MADAEAGLDSGLAPATGVAEGRGVAVGFVSVATREQEMVTTASATTAGIAALIGERRRHHRSVGAYSLKIGGERVKMFALVTQMQIGGVARREKGAHEKDDG